MSERITVGDRVRCVNDGGVGIRLLVVGRTYRVNEVIKKGHVVFVVLDGLCGEWNASRFEKIDEGTTCN